MKTSFSIQDLLNIKEDDELVKLGFIFKSYLREVEGYKNYNERLCVWENNEAGISVLTHDLGNGWCGFVAMKSVDDDWIKPIY